MSAKKVAKADKAKTTLVPVKELIAVQAERLGLSNPEIAERLGYEKHNVISMLKSGVMRLPINKIAPAAEVLKIDPLYLAMCVDAENDLNLAPLLEQVSKRTAMTLNEEKLIQRLRKVSHGFDVDLDEYPQELATIIKAFETVAEREFVSHQSDVSRIESKPRSALGSEKRKLQAELEAEAHAAAEEGKNA